MTGGLGHYRAAEKCLETLGEKGPCGEDSLILMAEAQVHATLALAAATALTAPAAVPAEAREAFREAGAW